MSTFETNKTWSGMELCWNKFNTACAIGHVAEATLDFLIREDLVDSFNAHCDLTGHTELTIILA